MGSAKIEYVADVAKVVQAMDRIIEKQVKVRRGAEGVATSGRKAGDEMAKGTKKGTEELSSMEKVGKRVTDGLKTYLGAAMGIAGVAKAWSFVNAEIRKVAEAQSMLAMTGKEYNRVSLQLANQMGQARTNVGQRLSADVLESIQKAGRFGADWQRGKAAGIAAHVAFGIPGQLLAGEALDIAKVGAEFAGYKGIGAEETGGMFKVLKQAGVTGKMGAARRMRQFAMAYEAALSVDPSANIGGIVRFIGEYVKGGGTFEMGLGRFGEAIVGTGSEQEAAQRSRQMVMIMRGEKMQATLAERMGLVEPLPEMVGTGKKAKAERKKAEKERAKELVRLFSAIPMDVRMEQFGEFAAGATETQLKEAGVADRRLGWVMGLYGKGGFANIMKEKQRLMGATGQQLLDELAEFGGTFQAAEMLDETKAALLEGRIGRKITLGETKMGVYRAMHKRHIAGEEVLPYFRHAPVAHFEDWLWREKGEVQIVAYRTMEKRLERIKKASIDTGGFWGTEWRGAGTEAGRLYGEAVGYLPTISPANLDPLTPREVGKMEEYLVVLEAMVDELKKNTDAMKKNTDGKEEGMRMNVMDPDANVE
jgi:hypothetical protein